MNTLKLAVLGIAFLFLLVTFFFNLPALVNNIIYGIMSIGALFFMFIKRDELKIDSMFNKEESQDS